MGRGWDEGGMGWGCRVGRRRDAGWTLLRLPFPARNKPFQRKFRNETLRDLFLVRLREMKHCPLDELPGTIPAGNGSGVPEAGAAPR